MSITTESASSAELRASSGLQIHTVPASQQATGAFDHGRITERKPIGMPHDRAPQKSVGPLFYWAWAQSQESGKIGMHPHQGFEILSYVLEGEMLHRDTLGSESLVTAGGVQIQQAGSGMSHEEVTGPAKTDFFQIWFQPDLQAALQRPPKYGEFAHGEFPLSEDVGKTIKTVLGEGSPISLVTEAEMVDLTLEKGSSHERRLGAGRALIAVTVEGRGQWLEPENGAAELVQGRDCTTLIAREDHRMELRNVGDSTLRTVLIEVPLETGYRLYR